MGPVGSKFFFLLKTCKPQNALRRRRRPRLLLLLWSTFQALRTFTSAATFVKLVVSGPKTAENEDEIAQHVVRCFFKHHPHLRPAGTEPAKYSYDSRENQLIVIAG